MIQAKIFEEQIKGQMELYKQESITRNNMGRPFSQEPPNDRNGPEMITDDHSKDF